MKTLKLTVKNYKHINIGHEGGAMTCDLYVDGVLAAKVENGGYGGTNEYRWVGQTNQWKTPDHVQAHIEAQPEQDMCGMMLKPDLDCLVYDAIMEADIAKKCKKAVIFTLPTDEKGTIRTYKTPYTPAAAKVLRATYPTAIIYNETLAA